ncbi:MAG: hypothetical protein R3E01_26280 [Pirellulaceae bacterium]
MKYARRLFFALAIVLGVAAVAMIFCRVAGIENARLNSFFDHVIWPPLAIITFAGYILFTLLPSDEAKKWSKAARGVLWIMGTTWMAFGVSELIRRIFFGD